MRIWSLHPKYLDVRGLVALWREALLAQAVLRGKTKGYVHHPQLIRFCSAASPIGVIAAYLMAVHAEATLRGYRFDARKISRVRAPGKLTVTRGQLEFEWHHLMKKLSIRAPQRRAKLASLRHPVPHPIFQLVRGGVAPWEKCISPPKKILQQACRNRRGAERER